MGARGDRTRYELLGCVTASVSVLVAIVLLENLLLATYFPRLSRVTTDFSPTYLGRELKTIRSAPPQTLFFGDSVLWGYRLHSDETAVSLLASRGCACRNLALKAGGPASYYAFVRLLQAYQIRPRAVVLEIDQKGFNQADGSYRTLHPAVAALAGPLLTSGDRSLLALPRTDPVEQAFDRTLSQLSLVYAMRADIRSLVNGDEDLVKHPRQSADLYEGTYDLTPLNEKNVAVHFLSKTAEVLHQERVQAIAFLTPTNHVLLHDYIDSPEYRSNGAYLQRLLERHGIRVLDLDAAFPASEFFDDAHLTAAGQRRLAAALAKALSKPGRT